MDDQFRHAFVVRHDLATHPLLDTGAIAALAERLPPGSVEASTESAPVVAGLDYVGTTVTTGLADAVGELRTRSRSLYLYNVERDPEYRALVDGVLDEVIPLLGVEARDVVSREGYLFLAGDRAVTSAHVDHECNFLLVLRGTKRVWLAPVGDPDAEIALEALHSGRYGTCAARPADMTPYDLGPGDGIFIPPRAAHFVENGEGGCEALSIVFLHRRTRDEVGVYAWNARLRRVGLTPNPPGASVWCDRLKGGSFRAARRLLAALGRARRGSHAP